jgi:tetratricopeptide (TPR) repeat protein
MSCNVHHRCVALAREGPRLVGLCDVLDLKVSHCGSPQARSLDLLSLSGPFVRVNVAVRVLADSGLVIAATRFQPNERLRAQRLRRAWSLDDVVRELRDLADRLGERPLGVNATMVYNWETGRHRPRPPYPRLLCLLYECSAEELGLWAPAGVSELRRASGLVVPPPGFAGRWPERPLRVSEATVHNLESVTAAYRRMYHTVAAHDLIDDVAQHAQTTAGFWRRTADPELRRGLAAASEITMLAGRMSFFDLGRPSQAEPYYHDALEAAQEAQDRPLQAVVLGNKSFLPRSRGDYATALQLLDQAKQLVPDDPIVRSWAMALEAMTKAWGARAGRELGRSRGRRGRPRRRHAR